MSKGNITNSVQKDVIESRREMKEMCARHLLPKTHISIDLIKNGVLQGDLVIENYKQKH